MVVWSYCQIGSIEITTHHGMGKCVRASGSGPAEGLLMMSAMPYLSLKVFLENCSYMSQVLWTICFSPERLEAMLLQAHMLYPHTDLECAEGTLGQDLERGNAASI